MKPRLWKVGELIRHSGLTRQTIHNYCLLGLIQEAERTPSGHRLYDKRAFKRLERIEQLKRAGKQLVEIADLLPRRKPRHIGSGGDEDA
ncbi:MAG: MerR family DNA-binding transcriptional regulator [Planctomycetes bacterium]|nr:MerR family DNA-binding transcriptional regulator [Planctomycetota bacterium]